jgi:Leucine-rich repeat (LRR) protein
MDNYDIFKLIKFISQLFMKITITDSNIEDFANEIFDNIIKITWNSFQLDKLIIKNFPNLQRLIHTNINQLTSLDPLANCINLRILYCDYNQITLLDPLANCINLRILHCNYNQIISLNPLANCVNLEKLYCDRNQIISLNPLANCINLQLLYCNTTQTTLLNPLANCINLRILHCYNNQITSLNPLANCVNLEELYCNGNQIISLNPLANCINLRDLDCCNNQITSLERLVYLRHLNSLDYSNNPLTIQSIQVQRFLDRFNIINRNNSIYQDKQNVHDVTIQKTICDSLQSLLRDSKPLFTLDDVISSNLSFKSKESLIEYCQDESVHSVHLVTYGELLSYVWQRIINSDHKEELFRILEEQMAESECKYPNFC